MSDHCPAWMNFNIVLVPRDRDVFVRELQLEPSSFAFLYSLVLYWRDKFEPDT